MAYNFMSLEEALRDLPTLSQVLGREWVERENEIPLIESKFPLARTLRIEELRNLVVTLDRSLKALAGIDGARDWRSRLRHNGQEFRELLSELTFAKLLQERGFDFAHPSDGGPDFAVKIGDEPPLLIEVTTPRIVTWADDLQGRLWVLSRQYAHSVRLESLTENSPVLRERVTETMMLRIVHDTIELLSKALPDGSPIEQTCPDIGLKIIWTPSSVPRLSGYFPPNSSPISAFNYIANTAEDKLGQLRKANAHTLVIGTNQLPFPEWEQYVTSLRGRVPFYGEFHWDQIPDQVKYIVLFLASYCDSRAPAVDVLVRPGDESIMPEGLRRFLEELRLAGEDYHRQRAEDVRQLIADLRRYEARRRKHATDEAGDIAPATSSYSA